LPEPERQPGSPMTPLLQHSIPQNVKEQRRLPQPGSD